MSELGGRKLVIFAYYQNTIRALKDFCKPWNAVEIYGKLTAKVKMQNLNRFLKEDDCKILIGQPLSMGSGLDGIKKVCTDILFVELPMIPKELIQAIGRIDRNGQTETCRVRLACAKGTVQMRRQDILLAKDTIANRIQYSYKDLRDWLFGG
nr:helicase-related protein [Snodgrassella sp. W8158]